MTVVDTASADATRRSDFTELHRRVPDAGLLRKRPPYCTGRTAALPAAPALLLTWSVALGASRRQPLLTPLFTFALGRPAPLGHGIAHHAVFTGRRATGRTAIALGNPVIGVRHGWRVAAHRHHAHPRPVRPIATESRGAR
jgi:fatty acid desaturase